MEVTFLGHSSFKLRGKTVTVVTDPFNPEFVKMEYPKVEADIVTVSHDHSDHNFVSAIGGGPFIINRPGEYEVKGVSVFGFSTTHGSEKGIERGKNTIFLIEIDGLRICHLGDLGEGLSSSLIEEIGVVDILFVPVGGVVTIGPEEAADLISQIEPYIIIPMHFKDASLDEKVFGNLKPVTEFLAKMGAEGAEKLDKLSIAKDKLPLETKVVVMERKN